MADSEADSSGPQSGASEVAFSVIAGLAGSGQAGVCRGQWGRSWASRVPGHRGPGLYSQGSPTPSQMMIPSCGVRSGRGTGGQGDASARNSSGGGTQGPLRSAVARPSLRLDLSSQGVGARREGRPRWVRRGIAESQCQGLGQWGQELPSGEGTQITLFVFGLCGACCPQGFSAWVLGPRQPETVFPGERSQLCFWDPTLPSASHALDTLPCAVWG